jgi:hypothetical protein
MKDMLKSKGPRFKLTEEFKNLRIEEDEDIEYYFL